MCRFRTSTGRLKLPLLPQTTMLRCIENPAGLIAGDRSVALIVLRTSNQVNVSYCSFAIIVDLPSNPPTGTVCRQFPRDECSMRPTGVIVGHIKLTLPQPAYA